MTYAEKLKNPKWQKKRLEVLQRDNFTCQLCKSENTTLHVHHFAYDKSRNPWDSDLSDMITYCCYCHEFTEIFNKQHLTILKIIRRKSRINDNNLFVIIYSDIKNDCFVSFNEVVDSEIKLGVAFSKELLNEIQGSFPGSFQLTKQNK